MLVRSAGYPTPTSCSEGCAAWSGVPGRDAREMDAAVSLSPEEREAARRLAEISPGCTLVDSRVFDDPVGRCNRCGEPLPLRKDGVRSLTRRWCSPVCDDTFWRNHMWTTARRFALLRAQLPLTERVARAELTDLLRWGGPLYSLRPRCERCHRAASLEVNHVLPRNGGGYGNGCHHHQTNLEPLCHPCHVAETTAQIRERLGIPEGGRPAPIRAPGEAVPEPLWDFA